MYLCNLIFTHLYVFVESDYIPVMVMGWIGLEGGPSFLKSIWFHTTHIKISS